MPSKIWRDKPSHKSAIRNPQSAIRNLQSAMLRTGIDLIEVERVAAAITRYGERFTRRVYTDGEIAYCAGRVTSLAARFAAKEAVSKLLGVGIQHRDSVDWREIEVVSAANGFPTLALYGKAQARARELGLQEIALSFSHTREHAIAFVVGQ